MTNPTNGHQTDWYAHDETQEFTCELDTKQDADTANLATITVYRESDD